MIPAPPSAEPAEPASEPPRPAGTLGTLRVGERFQGPTGSGQGGWTAHLLSRLIGQPITVAIRAPIPLERDLTAMAASPAGTPASWKLVDTSVTDSGGDGAGEIMIATPWTPDVAVIEPVSIADAALAGRGFPLFEDHPVPLCFSCGIEPDSMNVHSGQLADGRFATDWTVPSWAADRSGRVEAGVAWAAIDCAQAWYVGLSGGRRHSVTVQIAVDVRRPLVAGETLAIVAGPGDYEPGWQGRKRGACGAIFDRDGELVASSRTFWVAID